METKTGLINDMLETPRGANVVVSQNKDCLCLCHAFNYKQPEKGGLVHMSSSQCSSTALQEDSLDIPSSTSRFSDEPLWLALEWTDGAPPAMYISPARDALLTAVLDMAQVPPPQPTHPPTHIIMLLKMSKDVERDSFLVRTTNDNSCQ